LLDILKNYFRNAAKYYPKPEDAGKTTYFSKVGASFIFDSAHYALRLQPTSPLFSQHQNLLKSLATSLQDLHDDLTAHPPPDYLFFASFTYVFCLLYYAPDAGIIKTDIGQSLILAILQYRAHIAQLRRDIEVGFCNALYWSLFELDWPKFVQLAEKLGVVLPPSAARLATDPTPEGTGIQEETREPCGDALVDIRVHPRKQASQDTAYDHSSSAVDNNTAVAI